ncbi:MAG: pyridoxamine 5'-phosphate oxidase family protein [Rhodothermales bacterium]|nr:pyridoxamine 5'-phosphate oxidase family protein [Rhodothermales bacterium]MBO6779223.1 pyridoxamine 5'-phosphate oxidase family protein [Rhodothermales bacterium]
MNRRDIPDRSRLRRIPDRASYDREDLHAVLDAAPICHVAFEVDGQPFVIPTIHARHGDEIVIHGAKASRLIKHAATGAPLAIAVTMLDGLVLARSVFHSSMNYRSAVVFGTGRLVEDAEEKMACMEAVSEHLMPGRWADARGPSDKEFNATSIVAVSIDEATVKARTGPPGDDEEDYALPVWAGVVETRTAWGPLTDDPGRHRDVPVPDYLKGYE